jgi:hypothetical protein
MKKIDEFRGALEAFKKIACDKGLGTESKRIHDEGMVTVGCMREKVEAERKRADALAATIAALRDVVTTDAETKEEFVSRVRAVLGEDPDARVLGAVLVMRERCAKLCDEAAEVAKNAQAGQADDLTNVLLRHHAVAHTNDAAAIRALK